MQLDAAAGQALKRAGMQIALDFSGDGWPERVLAEFRVWSMVQMARGLRTVTIEEFRAQSRCAPESHKAWGSLPTLAMRAGLIAPALDPSGNRIYRKAASPKTHSHVVSLWLLL